MGTVATMLRSTKTQDSDRNRIALDAVSLVRRYCQPQATLKS